ncbi:MAG: hypothetical protein K0S81_3746 [Rhodospirillales bacterium]|jgi:hypothetical protein|nr:hypothetical protein [Rhodospirillales bacterium]
MAQGRAAIPATAPVSRLRHDGSAILLSYLALIGRKNPLSSRKRG